MKTGKIKYDDKHDSYFIQVKNKVYTCFTIEVSDLVGDTVEFEHNGANEVTVILEPYFTGDDK